MKKFNVLFLSILLIGFGGCYKMCGKKGAAQDDANVVTDSTGKTTTNTTNETPTTDNRVTEKPVATSSFSYTPTAPVDGKLKGVIELGAAGFNSFIVNVDANKNWKLEKADFGSSFVYEKMASDEDIKSGIKKYIAGMLDYGVKGNNIHFVVSSAAIKDEKVKKIIASLKALGYVANPVTAEQEGQLAAKTVLPIEFEGNSFVVDIGSGNTKISWMENGKIVSYETYGSKYYDRNISDDQVSKEVAALASKIPQNKRLKCFIIGGAPFELAKQVRKDKERYTVLAKPESYKAEGAKIRSGLNIYKALIAGTQCDTFIFDWDSNFTIGFLLSTK